MKRAIFVLSFLFLQFADLLEAAPVKISFLNNNEAIQETASFLLSKGCDTNSVDSFRRVIDWYNASPSDLDLGKFPKSENGFYSFSSVSNLIGAFRRPLIGTYHQNELNCFETVILLAGSLIQTTLEPDDSSDGPFMPPVTLTNYTVTARPAATPRDVFTSIYPPWWIEISKRIFTGVMQDKSICLSAAFDSFYFLPHSTTRKDLGSELLKLLQSSWKRDGIEFPANLQVVICYDVFFDERANAYQAVSSHAGLLFQNDKQYVFVDKLGVSAPYVRFDFENRDDLFLWLRAELDPTMNRDDLLFVSFNDRDGDSIDEISR